MQQPRSRPNTCTTPIKHDDDAPAKVTDVTMENLRMMEAEEEMDSLSTLPKQNLKPRRPENLRSVTEPTPAVLLHEWFKEKDSIHDGRMNISNSQRRNRSPYSRSHLRSRSTGASGLSAPLMARAHSLPNPSLSRPFDSYPSSGNLSPSPLRGSISPRARSPFKPEEAPRSPSWLDAPSSSIAGGIESIQEDSELDITPRSSQAFHFLQPQSPMSSRSNSQRSSSGGRRPPSPLHSLAHSTSMPSTSFPAGVIDQHAPLNMSTSSNSGSGSNSPALGPQKYNEAYPFANHFHSSTSTSSFSSFSFNSHPSTPTSARSRSPSISSLETIEDAPEQETEAEAALAQLKLAAAQAGESESDGEGEAPGRRRSLDAPRARRAGAGGDAGRKRWSICGGERRADLDLETIWED